MKGDDESKRPHEDLPGRIEQRLPNDQFQVKLDDGRVIRAMVGRAQRFATVKVIPGDRVLVRLFDLDPSRGSIVKKQV